MPPERKSVSFRRIGEKLPRSQHERDVRGLQISCLDTAGKTKLSATEGVFAHNAKGKLVEGSGERIVFYHRATPLGFNPAGHCFFHLQPSKQAAQVHKFAAETGTNESGKELIHLSLVSQC